MTLRRREATYCQRRNAASTSNLLERNQPTVTTTSLKIRGMDCVEEVKALRRELEPLPGVQGLQFDLINAKMSVQFADDQVDVDGLIRAVGRTGMSAEPWEEQAALHEQHTPWFRDLRSLMTIASGVLLVVGFVLHASLAGGLLEALGEAGAGEERVVPPIVMVAYALGILAGLWLVLPKAWLALRRMRPDMNLLMTVAVAGAVLIGEWFEASTVAFLFALSLMLESWSVSRARRAVAALMSLAPPKARIICPHDKCEELVDVDSVAVGTTVIVKPGEKFPLDGRITSGSTSVDQSPITGESLPVPKEQGDEVFAGTINGEGAVEFVSSKPATDTTLARIIRMVSEASGRRAPSEQWVDRFARYYTPAVMALAVVLTVLPPIAFGGSWSYWFYQALVLLVIACPCALVISTPVSIVSALASAARQGVLIKGGLFVEAPSRLRAIAFDKTGTLTEGKPAVREVVPWADYSEADLVRLAAAIEARSEHPLAHAILRYADQRDLRVQPAEGYQAIKGRGATASVGGRPVWVGSHRLLIERGQETPAMREQLERLSGTGASVVAVGSEQDVLGFIAIADRTRDEARAALAALRASGIEHLIMLTGDNNATAQAVAQEVGVDEVRAELLPEDKVRAVEELVERYGQVAMIGDGINDAPAMARASLGMAMGAAGTDAAIETADIALMSDDLSRLPWLVRHSRRTLAIIRQNIGLSLGVKAVFVLLTFAGLASLWAAIAADMGVSLLVVFNALRLLRNSAARADGPHALTVTRGANERLQQPAGG